MRQHNPAIVLRPLQAIGQAKAIETTEHTATRGKDQTTSAARSASQPANGKPINEIANIEMAAIELMRQCSGQTIHQLAICKLQQLIEWNHQSKIKITFNCQIQFAKSISAN